MNVTFWQTICAKVQTYYKDPQSGYIIAANVTNLMLSLPTNTPLVNFTNIFWATFFVELCIFAILKYLIFVPGN
jgi:hypothetical protein